MSAISGPGQLRRAARAALIGGLALRVLGAAPESGGGPTPVPARLHLAAAIGSALQNNVAIREARERIREREGVEITVKAQAIPAVSASAGSRGDARVLSTSAPPDNDRAWSINLQARVNQRQADYGSNVARATLRQARGQADDFGGS